MKPNVVIDTKGLFCPVPIMRTSDAMRVLETGGILEMISDDPAVEFDMPAWCRSQGHAIEALTREGDVFRYLVKKDGATST